MISMKRPSRGERESATTTRYRGRLLEPSRRSRIVTDTSSPPQGREAGQLLELAELALHAFELLHHLAQLRVLLEQPVHVLHRGAAAARDALAAAAVDDLGMAALARRHRGDDRVEAAEVGLLVVELGRRRPLEHLADRQHPHDLVERPHLAELPELLAEVVEREAVLAELPDQLLGLLLVDRLLRLLHQDRKSTRLNSSHSQISYAVFCLKQKRDRRP